MKTAKELKEESELLDFDPDGNKFVDGFQFTVTEFYIFCEQLCKEQREICAVEYYTGDAEDVSLSVLNIRNAPMPE